MDAIVLLSGGMDSCVTAAEAIHRHGSGRVGLLHASYGQRTEAREARAFSEIAKYYRIAEMLVARLDYFRAIGGSALTDSAITVPENEWAAPGLETSGIPVTYVPFRNAHFLSVAVSWAEVLGAQTIYIGAVQQDSSGYPDCRPEYYRAFNEVIRTGTRDGNIEIVTPLIQLRKSEIVQLGLELAAPFDLTWSCYSREDTACGICESCALRLRAFQAAGAVDPIPYLPQAARK
jgi:7-cyano-7-deazaguanine synthase